MTPRMLLSIALVLGALTLSQDARASQLAGLWGGHIHDTEGNSEEVSFEFSPRGLLIFSYVNNQGLVRQVELSEVGQIVQFVPAGGGVLTLEVTHLQSGPGSLVLATRGSFERTDNGYLTQEQDAFAYAFKVAPGGLQTEVSYQSVSRFGDAGQTVGDTDSGTAKGLLRRVARTN